MATKKMNKKYTTNELKGITKRQDNIIRLREKLNTQSSNSIKVFTIYKTITYLFVVLFPPYALYRLWNQKSTFNRQEQVIQSCVSVLFLYLVLSHFLGL